MKSHESEFGRDDTYANCTAKSKGGRSVGALPCQDPPHRAFRGLEIRAICRHHRGMPEPTGILETVLYTDDLDRAKTFYEAVMGLSPVFSDARMAAFDVAARGMLLIFRRGETLAPVETPFGVIPPHDGTGPLHIAFSIAKADLETWRETLAAHGIEIESVVNWPRGGQSLYFRDPDGHCLELATPGLWPGH